MMIKVHIACDDKSYRDAIADFLAQDEIFEVVATGPQEEPGVITLADLRPDVTVFAVPPGDDVFRHATLYRAAAGESTALVGFCLVDSQADDYRLADVDTLAFASGSAEALRNAVESAYRKLKKSG